MRWLKRSLWKTSIVIVGILLLLVLMVWVPAVAADAQEGASGLAATAMIGVQATPTEDATVTALNKEKLAQEVQQLKNQNETDFLSLLRTNASILLSTLIIVIGGLIGLFRWFGDRRDEREKRAEERFQSVVTGLGDEKEGAKIGAAILLRTFLRLGYEEFYTQTFDLAVANLRRDALVVSVGTRTADPPQDSKKAPLPLTALSQALIVVFKEAFPLARSQERRSPESLDATGIQLDNAYLRRADLEQVRMPQASLRGADLSLAKLSGAKLWWADLSGADLEAADLSRANLGHAILREVNLEAALSLKDTNLRQVIGLTKEQLEICKAKGAIIDEDAVASSTLSTVSSAVQSTTAQVPSAPPAQVNTPTPGTDGSSDLPSKPSNGV